MGLFKKASKVEGEVSALAKIEADLAIKVAEQILKLSTLVSDEELEESLSKISRMGAMYGVLWGAYDKNAGMTLDFYYLKGEVLEFLQKIRKNKIWVSSVLIPLENLVPDIK